MTATPKIYAPHITKKAKEEDVLICSMDDADMYGHPFYEIGFAEAVKQRSHNRLQGHRHLRDGF